MLLNFIITILNKRSWITNPHLKAKFVDILSSLTPHEMEKNVDLSGQLLNNDFLTHNIIGALLSFFIEVEKTGSTN